MYTKKIKFLQINIITHIHTNDSIAICKKNVCIKITQENVKKKKKKNTIY